MFEMTPWMHPAALPGAMRICRCGVPAPDPDGALWWPGERAGACVLCLHGHGAGADQPFVRPDIRDAWLPAVRGLGLGILSPELGSAHWMGPRAAGALRRLLAWARDRLGIDAVHVVAGSMGATAALAYAVLHPDDLRSVAALCPATDIAAYHDWCVAHGGGVRDEIRAAIAAAYGGPPSAAPAAYAAHSALRRCARLALPVLVVHGSADEVIPVEQSRRLAAARQGADGFTYIELDGGDHDAPLRCGRLWTWLREQRDPAGDRLPERKECHAETCD